MRLMFMASAPEVGHHWAWRPVRRQYSADGNNIFFFSGNNWSVLETLYEHATRLRLETIPHGWDSQLYIHLGYNPLYRVRKGIRERFMPKVP